MVRLQNASVEIDAQPTRASLLLRLRRPEDIEAWEQFVEIYTPIIHGFLRGKRVQDADACDLSQEVMGTVARTMQRFEYDPQRGRFRGWLLTVTHRKLIDFNKARNRRPNPAGESTLQAFIAQEPSAEERAKWEADYHQRLFEWAANQLRPKIQETTWLAFWRTAIEEQDPVIVAADLNIRLGTVYAAKSRVLARLRALIQSIDEHAETFPVCPPRTEGVDA
jgi:RNA polymerase sigma-70 factor (ECF subfamily)